MSPEIVVKLVEFAQTVETIIIVVPVVVFAAYFVSFLFKKER